MQRESMPSRGSEEVPIGGSPLHTGSGLKCARCEKLFSRPENLARHIRAAHTNDAQFQCLECRKRFTRGDLLKKHLKIHNRRMSSFQNVDSGTGKTVTGTALEVPGTSKQPNGEIPRGRGIRGPAVQVPISDNTDRVQPIFHNDIGITATPDRSPILQSGGAIYGEGLFDVDLAWTFDFVVDHDITFDPAQSSDSTTRLAASQISEPSLENPHSVIGTSASLDTDQAGWPDGKSRPASPVRGQQISPFGPAAFVDQHELEDVRRQYGPTTEYAALTQYAIHEIFKAIDIPTLHDFCGPGPQEDELPDSHVLEHFLRLFFIFVQPRFPIVHVATFSSQQCPPELLIAMLLAGSSHSHSNQGRFVQAYVGRTRMLITLSKERDGNYLRDVRHLTAFFLLCLIGTWCGQTEAYRRAESDRGILISACRRNRLLDCRADTTASTSNNMSVPSFGLQRLNTSWKQWIGSEQRKRLGLSIYVLDCQYAALLQRQPYISKAETTNAALPCQPIYWEASTAQGWKLLLGPADTAPSIYHLPTLTSILLGRELAGFMYFPPIDEFSRLLYTYIIHTHIFEFRQAVSMLNTTGLRVTPVSFAPEQIGEGLLDRQRWLDDTLETWSEAYGSSSHTTPQDGGARVLYHLGHLALNVDFSDLHVVAGRSASDEDISLAAESLHNRLTADVSFKILKHASRMLDTAFEIVRLGQAQLCSYEVAIGLFMGGLVYWATIHTLQQRELAEYLGSLRQQPSPRFPDEYLQSQATHAGDKSVLIQRIQVIITTLRSQHYLGFSNIFASVLEKLYHAS